MPAPLARVIQRAGDPQPGWRYQRAEALEADLMALAARPPFPRLASAAATMIAVLLAGAVAWEVLGRQLKSSSTPGALLAHIAGWNAAGGARASPPDKPAIAVLPVQISGSEPGSDYYVEGLTDEIIRTLGVIDGLSVRSRSSSFAFKNTPRNLRDVGEQLRVSHVVEVAVLRAGDRVRINAQLFQVEGEVSLWANQFDGRPGDIFAAQDEISQAIGDALRLTFGRGQRVNHTNLKTYDLYLRGRDLVSRKGTSSLDQAADLFRQALAGDPAFARAHAGLAHAYALRSAPISSTQPYEPLQSRLRQAALEAVELDPLLADAHSAMGWVYARERDWTNAEKAFQQAIDLNPSLTDTYTSYSISTLQPLGKLDDALRLLHVALVNDPLSLDVQREIGTVQLLAGRYDEAIGTLQRVRATDPGFPFVGVQLGRALTFAGRPADALLVLEGLDGSYLGRLKMPGTRRAPWLAHAYVATGRRADAESLVVEHRDSPSALALIYAALGDHERAFEALERLALAHPHHVPRLMILPEMAGLRDDVRFRAMRERFGLPAE